MEKLQEISINKFAEGLDAKAVQAKLFPAFNDKSGARISAILIGTEPGLSATLQYYGELSENQEKMIKDCRPKVPELKKPGH